MQDSKTPKIRVLVRKRPMNKKQLSRGETDIITIENSQTVLVREQKFKVDLTPYIDEYRLNFDGAYDELSTNEEIYDSAVRPLVDSAFDGAKVTCFAYGQTGSGKTHTMLGNGNDVKGLYYLASLDIFQLLNQNPDIEVGISFYEIYCGKLYDLLNEKNILHAREDAKNNVNIVGLSETKVYSPENLMEIISYGTGIRVTSQNGTNNDSSRSHAILQISLKRKGKIHGKVSFIDLAGSQRAADHADQLQKQTRIDGAEINKSLLALKQCIRALDQNKNHTPFRGSKLTMVLKDSFTGYCRTVMIGNIAPNSSSSENTLNTLKYADRVKELKKANRQNFIEMEKMDQLQRELMLPRNPIQPTKMKLMKNQSSGDQGRQNLNIYGNRNHGNSMQPLHKIKQMPSTQVNNINGSIKPIITNYNSQKNKSSPSTKHNKGQPQNSYVNMNAIMNNNNFFNNNPNNSINHSNFNYPIKQIPIQQHEPTEVDFSALSEKHDQCIEAILEEEEKLIKDHEQHINETIELTKKEMHLRNEADKIGSNIEQYLQHLDEILERKMSSISMLKDRIYLIKDHLKESKRIEEQYSQMEKYLYQQQEESLLDDDDQLFA